MADQNTSLPVRTQNNGDVAVKVVDGTTVSQALSVDASGRVTAKLNDGSGNAVTSQVNGAQRALDVGIDVAGVQIDPRSIRALTSADQVTALQGTTPWVSKDQADGPVAAGTAASFSALAGGTFVSTTGLTTPMTSGQQSALQTDANGRLLIGSIAGTTVVSGTVTANQGTANATPWNDNIAQIAGAVPSATNALPSQIATAGAFVSAANPLPVSMSAIVSGTAIQDYHTSAALAAGASATFTYTVVAAHTLSLQRVWSSASGKIKVVVQLGASTIFVGFNSTANPNVDITIVSPPTLAAASTVNVVVTNLDILAQDVYATIEGNQN